MGKEREMERLTKPEVADGVPECYLQDDGGLGYMIVSRNLYRKIVERLKMYEDLKDSGRLRELPCAVGTPVYYIQGDCEGVPKELMFVDRTFFSLDMLGKIGTEFFLTREAAEEALERMVDGNE